MSTIARWLERLGRLLGREAPAERPLVSAAAPPPEGDFVASKSATLTPELVEPEPIVELEHSTEIEPIAERGPNAEAAPSGELAPFEAAPVSEAVPSADAPPAQAHATPASTGGLVLRLESERSPASFEITRTGATLGRGEENMVRLTDLSVSRRHARISYRQGGYWISDLGSMGGTWVDGTRLNAAQRLRQGQTIDIGVCRLTVAAVPDAAGASRPVPPLKRAAGR